MSLASAGGGAQGLSSGFQQGISLGLQNRALKLQEKAQREASDIRQKEFQLRFETARLKNEQALKQAIIRNEFFNILGGSPLGEVGGIPAGTRLGRAKNVTPSAADSEAFDPGDEPPQGPTTQTAPAPAGQAPQPRPVFSGGSTPQTQGQTGFNLQTLTPQQALQLGTLANQAGQGELFNTLVNQGFIGTPAGRTQLAQEQAKLQRSRLQVVGEELENRKLQSQLRSQQISNMRASGQEKGRQQFLDVFRTRAEGGDQRAAAAFLAAQTGDFDRAIEIGFPNIDEPTSLFQAMMRETGSAQEAAERIAEINRRPNQVEIAQRAADGDEKAIATMKILKSGSKEVIESDGKGGFRITRGGEPDKFPPGVRAKKLESLSQIGQGLIPVKRLISLLESNPDLPTRRAAVQQFGLNLAAQLKDISPDGPETEALFKELREGSADFGSFQTLIKFSAAGAARASGLSDDGRMSDGDFNVGLKIVGAPEGVFDINTSGPQMIGSLKELVAVSEARAELLRSELGIENPNPSDRKVDGTQGGRNESRRDSVFESSTPSTGRIEDELNQAFDEDERQPRRTSLQGSPAQRQAPAAQAPVATPETIGQMSDEELQQRLLQLTGSR